MKIFMSPVAKYCVVSVLLINVQTCFKISKLWIIFHVTLIHLNHTCPLEYLEMGDLVASMTAVICLLFTVTFFISN